MDSRVLHEFKTAQKRTDAIMGGMEKAQLQIENALGYTRKGFKFVFIYNILKVITMSQTIMFLNNEIKEKDQVIVEKVQVIVKKDQVIVKKDQVIVKKDQKIEELKDI